MSNLSRDRLLELVAQARAKQAAAAASVPIPAVHHLSAEQLVEQAVKDSDPNAFTWNERQQEAIDKAVKGESFCFIGAAGTGKTTAEKEIVRRLIVDGKVSRLTTNTKYLVRDLPGIVLTSFTRRAVRNMRKVVSEEMKQHCITLHKLLEYEPVFYEVFDQETQSYKSTMRFEPMKNRENRLPDELRTIIIDESSMVSTDLFQKLLEALPDVSKVQFIFVGDLHQLPPVYGQAILGFKLLGLPTIELTQIYRQAQESPIIALAHRIKNGEDVEVTLKNQEVKTSQGMVTIRPWKKPLSDFDAAFTASAFLKKLVLEGDYNEEEDIILCPQEKTKNTAFGTNEFNRIIAQALGDKRGAEIHEVIAGYEKHYLAVGDRLLVGREDAIIKSIAKNSRYWGKRVRPASKDLDRWGNYRVKPTEAEENGDDFDEDKYLESFSLEHTEKDEDRKQEASHIIDVELLDSGAEETLSTAGELNGTQFAYALTVHKAQGSEWERVFFLTHQSHVVMWSRELIYTAVTRARNQLYIICEPDRAGKRGTLWKAAKSPRIKGDTLAEKAEYFKGKQEEYESKYEPLTVADPGRRIYKEKPKESAPVPKFVPAPEPVKLIRLCDFVSNAFKSDAKDALERFWTKARVIWGDKIGELPTISYNLQKHKVVGLARLNTQEIVLNPLWCIMAEKDEKIAHEMLHETLGHEVAHLVAWKYSHDRGHDSGWIMAMKLLGLVPAVTVTDTTLPTWAQMYESFAKETMAELQAKGGDVADDYTHTNYDEV